MFKRISVLISYILIFIQSISIKWFILEINLKLSYQKTSLIENDALIYYNFNGNHQPAESHFGQLQHAIRYREGLLRQSRPRQEEGRRIVTSLRNENFKEKIHLETKTGKPRDDLTQHPRRDGPPLHR
jgi:hypothetical protein